MSIELSISNIVILIGAFQGVLLAFILLTTKRFQRRSNTFLALLLLSLALLNFVSLIEIRPDGVRTDFSRYHPFYLVHLIPPSIYFFIKYLTEPNYKWKKSNWYFFAPFIIELSYRWYKFSKYLMGDLLPESAMKAQNFFGNFIELLGVIYALSVLVICIRSLKKYENKLYENYSDVSYHSLNWLKNILVTGLILSVLWFVTTMLDFGSHEQSLQVAIFTLTCLSLLIYWVGYSMIIRQELLSAPIFAVTDDRSKEANELSSKTEEYYKSLLDLFENEKIFKEQELSMTSLSQKIGVSNSYLSQIINQKFGKTFFDLVNEYRIEEVKATMSDPKFEHYSILGLAQNAGFKSKSTFNSYFKKTTGKTPSEYKKAL